MDTAVQTFEPTPEPSPRPSAESPRLRTLLLTDLVDSTGLVERLGDAPASDLFRAHDRLVLQLQQQWRGRLIDRSDGMLLLFERPIDGLGFALDYTRGLIALGAERGIELRARIGLHVGEVLTWRNSEEAVSVGAKPVEVEGLAKPMAARLMATARPGQILLSAVAEPLAHRAARELGERGQHLAWKSWGRWRFKGVPESQYIFEVGEPGIAPLRMPPDTPKAWRDIPLWRRPAALAAEAALLAGLVTGAWFITKPEPAIAFNQRDWVVVGDLRNLTGQATLDDSLEQAFRISLEQSRHVNVLSDLKARDTLARMQRAPDTKLDRAIASEIALRDGARAVILPTVAEVGGRVRVSAEVIDPRTQTTVYTETAEGKGVASTLDSIDTVTAALRGKFGEAVKQIEKDSKPLPEVTTKNLDALHAYASGQRAFAEGKPQEALSLFRQALVLDPNFAMAHQAIARLYTALSDRPAALSHLDRALQLREGLPERDRVYLTAWNAELRQPAEALASWKMLANLYPDYAAGPFNTAGHHYRLNEFDSAISEATTADKQQQPLRALVVDLIGRALLAKGDVAKAEARFKQAEGLTPGVAVRRRAWILAVRERQADAEVLLESDPGTGFATNDLVNNIDLVTLAVDRGRWNEARRRLERARGLLREPTAQLTREFAVIDAAIGALTDPHKIDRDRLRRLADTQLEALESKDNPLIADDAFMALTVAYLAQRQGDASVARWVLERLQPWQGQLKGTVAEKMATIVRANQQRLEGRPEAAVAALREQLNGAELVQAHAAMWEALAAAGKHKEALAQAQWLERNRGRAYAEINASQVLQLLNVADTRLARLYAAQSLAKLGDSAAAHTELERLARSWPKSEWPDYLLRKTESIWPDSKANTTM